MTNNTPDPIYLNPADAADVICRLYRSQTEAKRYIPFFIHGPPGAGKTSVVNQCAKKLGVGSIEIIASQMDPVDTRGLPILSTENKSTVWSIPSYLPRDPESKGILFFDELPNAPAAVQNSLLKLILDRKTDEYTIPPGWIIIAAGNRASDKAHVFRLSSALTSRFIHIDLFPELENWSNWASQNDVRPEVIEFLYFKRENKTVLMADKFEHRSFPCPRTWEYASDLLKAGFQDKQLQALMEGTVGTGLALEFLAFLRSKDRVDPLDVLAHPDTAPIPENADSMWALISGLTPYVKKEENITPIIKYAMRVARDKKEDFSMILVRRVVKFVAEIDKKSGNDKYRTALIWCGDKKGKKGSLWAEFQAHFGDILNEIK